MNEPLRRAIFRAGLDEDGVAANLGVDPKTVRRWLEGRLPYPRLRWKLTALLQADETDLWPELAALRATTAHPAEVIAIYPHRRSIPRDAWEKFFASATREIAILAYAALFLAEDSGIIATLAERAAAGVRIRIALGDPDCPRVSERGDQETIGPAVAAKVRNALALFAPLAARPGSEIRLHQATLYNSIYQADNELLVNQHAYGVAAANAPVLHLRSTAAGSCGMDVTYLDSFESLWNAASPANGRLPPTAWTTHGP